MRRSAWLLWVLLLGSGAVVPTAGAPPADLAAAGTPEVLAVSLNVERAMLEEALRHRTALVAQRSEALGRLGRLLRAIDAEFEKQGGADPTRLDPLSEQLRHLDHEVDSLLGAERQALEQISACRRRIGLLETQLEELAGRQESRDLGVLTGAWGVVLLPSGQRGTWSLRQDGALVTGTYRLDGNWTGSLQGTLVERKLFLVRIDSRLGKMMEFEGYLSVDGQEIRGSWLNYELAGSEGATGQWSAQRRGPEAGP